MRGDDVTLDRHIEGAIGFDPAMSPKKAYTFQISDELNEGLKTLKTRDGIGEGEAIRRALTEFLERKGVLGASKADRKRVATRKRP